MFAFRQSHQVGAQQAQQILRRAHSSHAAVASQGARHGVDVRSPTLRDFGLSEEESCSFWSSLDVGVLNVALGNLIMSWRSLGGGANRIADKFQHMWTLWTTSHSAQENDGVSAHAVHLASAALAISVNLMTSAFNELLALANENANVVITMAYVDALAAERHPAPLVHRKRLGNSVSAATLLNCEQLARQRGLTEHWARVFLFNYNSLQALLLGAAKQSAGRTIHKTLNEDGDLLAKCIEEFLQMMAFAKNPSAEQNQKQQTGGQSCSINADEGCDGASQPDDAYTVDGDGSAAENDFDEDSQTNIQVDIYRDGQGGVDADEAGSVLSFNSEFV